MKKLLYVNLGVCEIQFLDVFLVFGFGFVNDILICIQEVYKSLLVIYTAVWTCRLNLYRIDRALKWSRQK